LEVRTKEYLSLSEKEHSNIAMAIANMDDAGDTAAVAIMSASIVFISIGYASWYFI